MIDPTTYTPCYGYRSNSSEHPGYKNLFCEGVSLDRIAQTVGTPTYVYSRKSIERAYRRFDSAFRALPHTLCYAVKANSNLSVLRVLTRLGSSFDIVSGGELHRLRRIGVSGRRIVYSGVGKTREEIREAPEYRVGGRRTGILLFNIESEPELEILLEEAARDVGRGGAPSSASIRVNPD